MAGSVWGILPCEAHGSGPTSSEVFRVEVLFMASVLLVLEFWNPESNVVFYVVLFREVQPTMFPSSPIGSSGETSTEDLHVSLKRVVQHAIYEILCQLWVGRS
jgi:hypothetical protein